MFRVITFNLNGIRSAAEKGAPAWVQRSDADCMCVQEVRAQEAQVSDFAHIGGLRGRFATAQRKGYAGVGIYTRREPSDVIVGMNAPEFDAEGRLIECRFDRPGKCFSIFSAYFPSGTSGDERQQAKYRYLDLIFEHVRRLRGEREFILCGDFNIAHTKKDIKHWRGNLKHSGFLPEERAWMDDFLATGLIDVYRRLYPEAEGEGYTWWSNRGNARANNVGWRIDYQIATPAVAALARHAEVYKAQRFSDHAPLIVDYDDELLS